MCSWRGPFYQERWKLILSVSSALSLRRTILSREVEANSQHESVSFAVPFHFIKRGGS